ncbi:hypothetical protein WG66_003977 [Moniliophthora roreri]|nr:hypothetical protein WG66_003977 [Moniliophthora roreri]
METAQPSKYTATVGCQH